MVTPQQNAPGWDRAAKILAQVGEELAFVEAGKDTGLLPINSLLMDFEELPRDGAPAVFACGVSERPEPAPQTTSPAQGPPTA